MRILILGGDGMLGHTLLSYFSKNHDVRCTLRQDLSTYVKYKKFTNENSYTGIDVRSLSSLVEVFADFKPEAVINCVGVVKQRPIANDSIPCLELNSLLPHRLSVLCGAASARLVHMSTDCVFNGEKGNYKEDDISDADDLYGRSKYLGEVHDKHCLTLRTSIIGRELSRNKSLVEWFLAQSGKVKGYKNVIYTGFTTLEVGRIIEMMLLKHPSASGVYQVSSEPINKYDLLHLLRDKLNHRIDIEVDESMISDKSLDSSRFRKEFDYIPPSWDKMIDDLKL